MLDVYNTNTFWSFDENFILLENKDPQSKGDSVGRNAFAYVFWPQESFLKGTILSCIKTRDDGYIQFYRYPNEGADSMSRDHVSSILISLYINRDKSELRYILDNLPLQLSRRYWQTLDFWLWQKAIKAEINENKIKYTIYREGFFLLNFLMFCIILPWNFILRKILRVKRYDLSEIPNMEFKLWNGVRRWVYQKLLYPQFALYNLSWMVRTLKGTKRAVSSLIKAEAQNFVIKGILGRKIRKEEYDSYLPINGFQWARVFDNGSDRIPRILTKEESEYNDIMRANLDYLYYGIDKIMLEYEDSVIDLIKNNKPIVGY